MTAASESTKHTPGPWTYSDSDCTHGGYGECREGCRVSGIWSPSREAEGAVFVTNPLYIRDRALIAAAPLLLEALQALFTEHFTFYPSAWEGDLGYHIGPGVCYGEACECGGEQTARALMAARGEGSAQ